MASLLNHESPRFDDLNQKIKALAKRSTTNMTLLKT